MIGRAVVQQENRLQVGLRRLHQLPPVGHRPGCDVLVRQHHARLGRHQPQGADEPALDHPGRGQAAVARHRAVGGDGLLVDVQRRLGVAYQDSVALPER